MAHSALRLHHTHVTRGNWQEISICLRIRQKTILHTSDYAISTREMIQFEMMMLFGEGVLTIDMTCV